MSGILRAAAIADYDEALNLVIGFAIDDLEQGITQIRAIGQLLHQILLLEKGSFVRIRQVFGHG